MTVKKQTQHDFRQRVRRLSDATVAPPGAGKAHRPFVNALVGASAAIPLYAATGPTFGPDTLAWVAWLPEPLREHGLLVMAAAIGASLTLLMVHLLRLVARRGDASRNSAAALTGASATATALIAFTTMPDMALAGYAEIPLEALRAAAAQITQGIPGIDLGGL